jgi:2-C-methyl-D-erythritol 4-phosphate cytidylyltransferase
MRKHGNVAIIVAAGSGQRMKSSMPKQFLNLANQPILWYTLQPFMQCQDIDTIFVVAPKLYIEKCENEIIKPLLKLHNLVESDKLKIKCIRGGLRRQDSVYAGLQAIEGISDIVVIHDGVRPFVTPLQISQIINSARKENAVIFGINPRDTVKMLDSNNCIKQTIDRNSLVMAQTPQAFSYSLIKKAHEFARHKGLSATDDAMLVELMDEKVHVVQGYPFNIKITTPEDLNFAKTILTLWPPDNQNETIFYT